MPLDLNAPSEQIMNIGRVQTPPNAARLAMIRVLNDDLRRLDRGGRVVMTAAIAALARVDRSAIVEAVRAFDAFDGDNDPHDEHDFAMLEVAGQQVMFKIDTYDLSLTRHSPDPADSGVTCRVMTIMLAQDY